MVTTPTYQELVDDATKLLYDTTDSPRIDAEVLLQHAVQRPLAWLISYGNSVATSEHLKEFYALVELRQAGQPIAYLTGYKEFWSLDLIVNPAVLIPRPDTETLVEQALERLDNKLASSVLDLGTGSGAIALAIAKERPRATVTAVDSQADALEVAKSNAIKNKISNVAFMLSNWFAKLTNERFSMIVSNPPYIDAQDLHLTQGDLRFEPDNALIAAQNGLSDLTLIIETATKHLEKSGWLLVEHGAQQGKDVRNLFSESGYIDIETCSDLNGNPRVSLGKWQNQTHE